jgi:N-acetylglutamate synthase-like GNAT family acetyltransferase
MMSHLRNATSQDIKAITELIALSARTLGGKYYDKDTIESALKSAFGVDTQLIKDQTYFVIEKEAQLIACGGWSYRKTLFGSDDNNLRDPEKLNPKTDAAKIRAFFIHPDYARQGLGNQIIIKCEQEAIKKGFNSTELMATLSGVSFYKKHGYCGDKTIIHTMNDGNTIEFMPMVKN